MVVNGFIPYFYLFENGSYGYAHCICGRSLVGLANLSLQVCGIKNICGWCFYPVAVLKQSAQPKLAQELIKFLHSEEAERIFREFGFAVAK